MKTRNGFVSNSSSSSFVVAFPKKPKTVADVFKYMFNGKEGGVSIYDHPGLSYTQVSEILFNDLKHGNFKKAVLNDVVEEFSGRLHYYVSGSNVFWSGKTTDQYGGSWSDRLGRYCGNNKELLEQLRLVTIESEENDKKLREKESTILAKSGLKQPKYAYKGGKDPDTQKPYANREVKAMDDYHKAMDKFRETNKEFIDFTKAKHKIWNEKYAKSDELSHKIAEEDAQNFLNDHKGEFVFIISYSDNDGATGSTMEHGDIFMNVPCVRISHH